MLTTPAKTVIAISMFMYIKMTLIKSDYKKIKFYDKFVVPHVTNEF